jgi:hypothetical protein
LAGGGGLKRWEEGKDGDDTPDTSEPFGFLVETLLWDVFGEPALLIVSGLRALHSVFFVRDGEKPGGVHAVV